MTNKLTAVAAALCLLLTSTTAPAQQTQPPAAKAPPPSKKVVAATPLPDPAEQARRVTAAALLNSLADEARDFHEPTLRARVQAEAADLLWESNPERARTLFRRAWDAARAADRENARRHDEEIERQLREDRVAVTPDSPNLRAEVLRLAARRDRALAEEFFKSLDAARGFEEAKTDDGEEPLSPRERARREENPNETTPSESQRLKLAREFLEAGKTDLALQTSAPALQRVTRDGVTFLSHLRTKAPVESDRLYAALLARTAADPNADANTVSLLSSYAFTPGTVIIILSGGGNGTMISDTHPPPALDARLHAAFFRTATQVLMRPLPPDAEDRSSAGRFGAYVIASRLLPLFEQYAPDQAALISARISNLRQELPEQRQWVNQELLTLGLKPPVAEVSQSGAPEASIRTPGDEHQPPPPEETSDDLLARIDSEALSGADEEQRERLYVETAMRLGSRGDVRAREVADKVEDTDLRRRLREYVDLGLALGASGRGDHALAVELARSGELSPLRRAYVLSNIARTFAKAEPARAITLLEEAGAEARRAEDAARAQALTLVATSLSGLDIQRVWTMMGELVKAANSADDFRGQDGRLYIELKTKRFASSSVHTAPEFDLAGLFTSLAADDLNRAADFARGFQNEAPRAAATLALARAVLEKKPGPDTRRPRS